MKVDMLCTLFNQHIFIVLSHTGLDAMDKTITKETVSLPH